MATHAKSITSKWSNAIELAKHEEWWINLQLIRLAETEQELAWIAEGVDTWERECETHYPGHSYLLTMRAQKKRIEADIDAWLAARGVEAR